MQLPQRHCIILQGDSNWLNQQALNLFRQVDDDSRCWLSDSALRPANAINSKQAQQQLGRDNQLIIFDGQDSFAADAFGVLIGTLQAGGWLLVLLPADLPDSAWLRRFLKTVERYPSVNHIHQGETLPDIVLSRPAISETATPTDEQTQVIDAVLHVVSGHRRRPLVITADRGRGKTALLGMAAAELLKQGKKKILITAPAISNIQPLLEHAAMALPGAERHQNSLLWQQAEIQFIAPDALITNKPPCDLLIIDEAAAIPASMLATMLQTYSRLVFSTTEHGYEGTGRGFAVRFKKTLDKLTPDWQSMTLTKPVRWAADDELEQFSFDALLLDAEPVSETRLSSVSLAETTFAVLDKQQLTDDELLLRQVYGLMVLAHYRTRPSDLQMLLDWDDISVMVMQAEGQVIASAWLVSEQPLPDTLAQQVFDGKRRLKGQLLPQTLLAHSGVMEAGRCRYQRIIRIAVHPALQGQGLGSRLLDNIQSHFSGQCDVIGTSFALDRDLLNFWLNNDYLPVRVGQQADEVSGQRAGILLRAISKAGESVINKAQQIWQNDWPFLLLQAQRELDHQLVILLSQTLRTETVVIEAHEQQAIERFAWQQRAFESTESLLWRWLQPKLLSGQLTGLVSAHQALLVKKIIQGQSFSQVASVLSLPGRKAIIEQLRQAVAALLKSDSE
ncbi:MAG TPA: GNAT family N-acetyltransferase [Methylophaga sp.]|nr:GNAT family N-acetyltransferase [Methylophaga sp.]